YEYRTRNLLPCGKVLELVTIEPAKALGIDHLVGSLEVGKKADIIAVDVMQPHLAPFGVMPIQRLVYHAMGQDVDWTIINGKVVMEDRRLMLTDEKALLRRAEEAFETMMKRLNRPELTENPRLYDIRQGQAK
ncbi:MAG: amidohydrolase family protein, partial [Firmicutes bacterium]|nr:amidohydrolase family protein [Bacillota bacterium]